MKSRCRDVLSVANSHLTIQVHMRDLAGFIPLPTEPDAIAEKVQVESSSGFVRERWWSRSGEVNDSGRQMVPLVTPGGQFVRVVTNLNGASALRAVHGVRFLRQSFEHTECRVESASPATCGSPVRAEIQARFSFIECPGLEPQLGSNVKVGVPTVLWEDFDQGCLERTNFEPVRSE